MHGSENRERGREYKPMIFVYMIYKMIDEKRKEKTVP